MNNIDSKLRTYNHFNANVVPLKGKRPLVQWKKWTVKPQSWSEVQSFPWREATGLAVMNGPGGWHSIDIDECHDIWVVNMLLKNLGLPTTDPWVVKTGSGFHWWFRSTESADATIEVFEGEAEAPFKQIELRYSRGYTAIPPSQHPTGSEYSFLNGKPQDLPATVDLNRVVTAIKELGVKDESKTATARLETQNEWGENVEAVESALQHIQQNCPTPSYREWLSIASGVVSEFGEEKGIAMMENYFPPVDRDGKDYRRKRGHFLEEYSIGTVFWFAENLGWTPPWSNRAAKNGQVNVGGDSIPYPTRAIDIEAKGIDWLWDGYIAKRAMHMVDGMPGTGKTTMLLGLCALLSRGKTPTGDTIAPQNVFYVSGEDTKETKLKPSYEAVGGDLHRGYFWDTEVVGKVGLPESADLLEKIITRENITFCVIDPLFSLLSRKFSKNSEQDVRQVLARIQQVAERTGCAFVLVRHPNKDQGQSALYRGGGSVGIIAQARCGFLIARHPWDKNKSIFAWTKSNISKKSLYKSVTFSIESAIVPTRSGECDVGTVKWLGIEAISAEDALSKQQGRPPTKKNKAKAFLCDELREGPRTKEELSQKCDELDFSESTLNGAAEEIPIRKYQKDRQWWWELIDDTTPATD